MVLAGVVKLCNFSPLHLDLTQVHTQARSEVRTGVCSAHDVFIMVFMMIMIYYWESMYS